MQLYEPLTEADGKRIRELLRNAAARNAERMFVVEGAHLAEMAITHVPTRIQIAAFTEAARETHHKLWRQLDELGVELRSMSPKLCSRISDTESPQGIFVVVDIEEQSTDTSSDTLILALDGVQDPGNVGTIIRTASWFGTRRVILGPGCADPYSPKVTRSTQGAIFTTAIEQSDDFLLRLGAYRKSGFDIIVSSLDDRSKSIYDTTFPKRAVIVLGSEAHGVSPAILEMANRHIKIPESTKSTGAAESLNVAIAAGIIISEATRR